MVNPARDRSGSKLVPTLRTRAAASRDNPHDAVGKAESCLIDWCVEIRCITRNQVFPSPEEAVAAAEQAEL
jgi:hypothetical protein